ncbi:MAG: hypothetical protein ACXV8M_00295 [Candidatus Angelobacter sp.]
MILIVCLMAGIGVAQTQDSKVMPSVTTVPIEEGAVTLLHLGPGYTTSVKMPEEISSGVIGNPASFKAEHSDAEPRLVFMKPITTQPSESNALITTKSGQEIPLHLVSAGKASANAQVDFFVECRRPQSLLVHSDGESFLIAETRPIAQGAPIKTPALPEKPDLVSRELARQKSLASPAWEGKKILAAVGESIKRDHQTVLGFSILNSSNHTIELLPPQIELSGSGHGNKDKRTKAEPIPISEYRMTARRLAPGQRNSANRLPYDLCACPRQGCD